MVEAAQSKSLSPATVPTELSQNQRSQPSSDQTEQFSRVLTRQEDARPKLTAKCCEKTMGDDTAAIPAMQLPAFWTPHNGKHVPKPGEKDHPDSNGISAGAASLNPRDGKVSHEGLLFTGAEAELATQFAERLVLPEGGFARSRLELDERFYTVSDIVIEGGSEDGLSIYYGSQHPGADSSPSENADRLRERLEARGLKVAAIRPD